MIENRYYYPELDLDGTADELFVQARNGYIDDKTALEKICEILAGPAEHKDEKARYVQVLAEISGDSGKEPYVFAQYKKDILDGCGSEEVMIRNDLALNVMNDRGSVLVSLEEYPNESHGNRFGGACIPVDKFLNYTSKDFDDMVGGIYYYLMQDLDDDDE